MEIQKHLSEAAIDGKIINLSQYFRKQRNVLQETNGESRDRYYPTEKIADNLEISSDMLQKKLNGSKPLSREWLVAICAAFGLDGIKTNEILNFAGYPKLDIEVPWECFITDFINQKDNINRPHTLKEINDYLTINGCNKICLKFRRNQTSESDSSNLKAEQYEIRKTIKIATDAVDTRGSLGIMYDFRSKVSAVAYLVRDGKTKYTLQASADGKHFFSEENGCITTYKNISETGGFARYFSELLVLVRNEQRRIEFQIFDTKNYQGRLGAKIKNDNIHVFYEEFNYYMPEKNEYHLMEYIDGYLCLSVCTQSMFMKEYLSEEDYDKHYGYMPVKDRITYNSYSELFYAARSTKPDYESKLLKSRCDAFEKLSGIVIDAIRKIKNRSLSIRDIEDIFENPFDVIKYYQLEKEFNCKYDEETGKICFASKKAEILYNDETVCISFEELKQSFELGLTDCEQICRMKKKYNSVKGIINCINLDDLEQSSQSI